MTDKQKAIEERLLRFIEIAVKDCNVHAKAACETYLNFMQAVEISHKSHLCPHCYEKLIADTDSLLGRKPMTESDRSEFMRQLSGQKIKCQNCQAEATVHIDVIGAHFCASCVQQVKDRIRQLFPVKPPAP